MGHGVQLLNPPNLFGNHQTATSINVKDKFLEQKLRVKANSEKKCVGREREREMGKRTRCGGSSRTNGGGGDPARSLRNGWGDRRRLRVAGGRDHKGDGCGGRSRTNVGRPARSRDRWGSAEAN